MRNNISGSENDLEKVSLSLREMQRIFLAEIFLDNEEEKEESEELQEILTVLDDA